MNGYNVNTMWIQWNIDRGLGHIHVISNRHHLFESNVNNV